MSSTTTIASIVGRLLTNASGSHEEEELELEPEGIEEWAKICYYSVAIPIMLVICFVSMVTNVCIVVSVGWVRGNPSPTLRFSVSLAGADAYASLVMGVGLIVNSLLPVTYGIDVGSACYVLVLECFRLAGLIVSVLHLLLLAFNHYVGIIRPLHYVSTVTRRNAMIGIALMWTVPLVFFFVYSSVLDEQGFRSDNCADLGFFVRRRFRIVVSFLFFVPLVLMTVMYCHMFVIVRQHNRGLERRRTQSASASGGTGTSGTGSDSHRHFRRNIKAAVTTLFILGTYVVGWMPAVVFFALVCHDCVVRLDDMRPATVFYLAIVTNTLIIVKFFVNPIIYAARMKDVRSALQRMLVSCVPHFLLSRAHLGGGGGSGGADDATSSFIRSRSETSSHASMRLHSVKHGTITRKRNTSAAISSSSSFMQHGTGNATCNGRSKVAANSASAGRQSARLTVGGANVIVVERGSNGLLNDREDTNNGSIIDSSECTPERHLTDTSET